MNNNPILLIDDKCTLCNRTAHFIVNHGGQNKFSILSLYSDEGRKLLVKYGFPADYDESVVLIEHEKAYTKSDAVLRVFKYLNGMYPYIYWFIIVPKALRNWVYHLVSKHRHRLYHSH